MNSKFMKLAIFVVCILLGSFVGGLVMGGAHLHWMNGPPGRYAAIGDGGAVALDTATGKLCAIDYVGMDAAGLPVCGK
jgi:hypothetical protein